MADTTAIAEQLSGLLKLLGPDALKTVAAQATTLATPHKNSSESKNLDQESVDLEAVDHESRHLPSPKSPKTPESIEGF